MQCTSRFFKTHTPWLASVAFVLFQFFLQLSSGVVIGEIMQERHLSALTAGLLSAIFYVIYTGLQVPVGVFFDRKNTRLLMSCSALVCSLGCFVFAASTSLLGLFMGRLLIGAGSAFAFIGLSHVLRVHYPVKQFAFMIGLSETLGFLATVLGMLLMGSLLSHWGWRGFIHGTGFIGLVVAYACFILIPNEKRVDRPTTSLFLPLRAIFFSINTWINGLFVGLSFTVVTVFGALWAVPFLQAKLSCGIREASSLSALFFFGTALSCPLFGWLSARYEDNRKELIITSCLSTALLLIILLFLPTHSKTLVSVLTFLVGLCCGAYMLAYSIANELSPTGSQSTCAGFTNMLAVLITPILQPVIGSLLDTFNQGGLYTLLDYQKALLMIPFSLILASVLVMFLPKKQ